MMSVPTTDAMKLAEIQAMRQLSDAVVQQSRQFSEHMGVQTRVLEKLSDKVDEIKERVQGLEMSGFDKRIEALKTSHEKTETALRTAHEKSEAAQKLLIERLELRVNQLESERDHVKGAASLTTWITKNAPWLLAGIAAFAAGMGWKVK